MKRRAVFIDSEPKHAVGGGIRTYLKSVTGLLHDSGIPSTIYTHNPEAYSAADTRPIGRIPWPNRAWRPFRPLAYSRFYEDTLAMESSLFLSAAIRNDYDSNQRFEFCDYNGYGYHSLLSEPIRTRSAVRIHTPLFLIQKESGLRKGLGTALMRFREMRAIKSASRVFLPSPEFATECLPTIKGQAVWNAPPPLPDTSTLSPNQPLEPLFLFAGRWEPRKGLHPLVQAFKRFVEKVPAAVLTIIGDPPNTEYGLGIAKSPEFQEGVQQGWIRLKPEVAGNKSQLFQGHSILVLPSLWENAPYLFQEAMGYGIIALGTKTGEMGEIQSHTHGIMPAPGHVHALVLALLELWERRGDAVRWRNLQWEWLGKRAVEAKERLLDTWTNWPIQP